MVLMLGDFPWDIDGWGLPPGCRGSVDLMPNAQVAEATQGQPRGTGVFVCDAIPAGWNGAVLASGDPRDARPDRAGLDAWQSMTGFRPGGDTWIAALWSHLTTGADPAGLDRCKPLVPTHARRLELHLAGATESRAFVFGSDSHRTMLTDLLKRQLTQVRTDSLAGKYTVNRQVDLNFHRRYAQACCEKYLVQFDAIRPATWPVGETLLPHGTVFRESFNKANSTTLGPDLTWAEPNGDMDVFSNQCRQVTASAFSAARAEHDLATDDHYGQLDVIQRGDLANGQTTVCIRYDSAANTHYTAALLDTADTLRVGRRAAGAFTTIGSTSVTVSLPDRVKLLADGSTLKAYWNADLIRTDTDTNITGFTRGGIVLGAGTSVQKIVDNFEIGDVVGIFSHLISGVGAAGLCISGPPAW